jgi:dihydroorotase-like cyclic amidohydrolase
MRTLTLFGLAALLGGCTMAAPPPANRPPPSPGPVAADASADRAIAACRDAAAAQQIAVRGVERAEEVRGGAGFGVGQNVFLAVSRSGSDFVLRCSYTYATAEARIMTL